MRDILHTEVTGADPERAPKDLERQEDMTQGEKERTLIMGEFSNPTAYSMGLIILQCPGPNSSEMMFGALYGDI